MLYGDGWLVHRGDPAFQAVAGYSARVIKASGLRRCPFHLEVIVDEKGPCLIEAAARIKGAVVETPALTRVALDGPYRYNDFRNATRSLCCCVLRRSAKRCS